MVPELRKRAPVALARAGAAQGAALAAAVVWRKLQREALDDGFQAWILPQLIQHVGWSRAQHFEVLRSVPGCENAIRGKPDSGPRAIW